MDKFLICIANFSGKKDDGCRFPFQQNGIYYNQCIVNTPNLVQKFKGEPCNGNGKCWCATSVRLPGDRLFNVYPYGVKTWKICDESCV